MPKKVGVHELSKELGISLRELLDTCASLGISVKTHSSSMNTQQADNVRGKVARNRLKSRVVEPQQRTEPTVVSAAQARASQPALGNRSLAKLRQQRACIVQQIPVGIPACKSLRMSDISELYHITHYLNLPSIFERGILSRSLAEPYKPKQIANPDVPSKRTNRTPKMSNGEPVRPLDQYVSLYFNPRNAMLYEVTSKYGFDVCILSVSLNTFERHNALVSDGNAASERTKIYSVSTDFVQVCPDCTLHRGWWRDFGEDNEKELKRRMAAEVLLPKPIAPSNITAINVNDRSTYQAVRDMELGRDIVCGPQRPQLFFR